MSRFARWIAVSVMLVVAASQSTHALGMGGFGLRVGMDLTQNDGNYTGGGELNSARPVLGGHVDVGSVFLPKLRLVPGVDLVMQDGLRIYSINTEARYYFTRGERGSGYAGGGIGAHLYRFDVSNPTPESPRDNTKFSLNIPVGFQRGLGQGIQWFGELKLVIADDESDSSFRFTVGLLTDLGL